MITIPGGVHASSGGAPYKVCVRYTEPAPDVAKANAPPVVIPNALGVTLACSSKIHEMMVDKERGVCFTSPHDS